MKGMEPLLRDLALPTEVLTYFKPKRKLTLNVWFWAEESEHIGPVAIRFVRDGYAHYWQTRREPFRPTEEKEVDRFSVLLTIPHIVELHGWLIKQGDDESARECREWFPVVFAKMQIEREYRPNHDE